MTKDSLFQGFELTPADYTFPMFYSAGAMSFRLKAPDTGIHVLQAGIERLLSHHPFLAGVVLPLLDNQRKFQVVPPQEQPPPVTPICTVRQLRQQRIPTSKTTCPPKEQTVYDRNELMTLVPVQVAESSDEPPVMRFQINVLANGLILGLFCNHMVIDGTGIGTLIQSLAICCRELYMSGPSTCLPSHPDYEASSRAILATVGEVAKATQAQDVLTQSAIPINDGPNNEKMDDETAHDAFLLDYDFDLSAAKIERMLRWTREQTPKEVSHGRAPVSADDIVTAVLWICVSQSRGNQVERSPTCSLQRVLNARRHIQPPLSANYLGNCFIFLNHSMSREELKFLGNGEVDTEESFTRQIGSIARFLRSTLNEIDDQFVRNHFSGLTEAPDVSDTSFHIPDTVVSSVRRLSIHEQNFGDLLGQMADFEILPYMVPEGCCTIKPRRDAESWEVSVALRSEEMDRLRSNPMFGWLVNREAPTRMFEAVS
jgi:fumigaclavine B O-acetyltransferase